MQTTWPVAVDMSLLRTRAREIYAQLRRDFDFIDAHFNYLDDTIDEDGYKSTILHDEDDQCNFRAHVVKLVESDPVLSAMDDFKKNQHGSVLVQMIFDEIFGFGSLGPVLRDAKVGDIWVDGPDGVFVECDGNIAKSDVCFEDEQDLYRTIKKILKPLGLTLSEESPVVRAKLPNGSWLVAALPPNSDQQYPGPILMIQTPRNYLATPWFEKGK